MARTKPHPFQLEGAKQIDMEFDGRALLADEMGLGKTFTNLLYLKRNPELRPALIVCPASLKWHWQREAQIHLGYRAEVLEGRKTPRRRSIAHAPLLIINYDILPYWRKYLKRLGIQALLLDEGHYCKSRKTKRTRACKALANVIPSCIISTGTPITIRPSDLWPLLNILRPDLFPNFVEFAFQFCAPKRTPWGWDYRGCNKKAMPKLNKLLLDTVMIRRKLEDVADQLPDVSRQIVPLDLSSRREYREAESNFGRWAMKNLGKAKATRALRAEQLMKMGYLKRLAAKLKMKALLEWVNDYLAESDGKLVVFGVHRAILGQLKEHHPKLSVEVNGSVIGRARQKAVDTFNHDDRCRLFLGNLQAAGVGWSAKSTSTTCTIELGWAPADHDQAEKRVRGIGRGLPGMPVKHFYLVAHDTIEEDLCKLLQVRQKVCSTVMDGTVEDDVGLDLFDQLQKAILERVEK